MRGSFAGAVTTDRPHSPSQEPRARGATSMLASRRMGRLLVVTTMGFGLVARAQSPQETKRLRKASGTALNGGGAPWPTASGPYDRVLAWIRAGARLDHAAAGVEAAAPAPDQPAGRHPGDRHEARTPLPATVPATPPPPT